MLTSKIKFNVLSGSQVLRSLDYVQYSDNIIFYYYIIIINIYYFKLQCAMTQAGLRLVGNCCKKDRLQALQ